MPAGCCWWRSPADRARAPRRSPSCGAPSRPSAPPVRRRRPPGPPARPPGRRPPRPPARCSWRWRRQSRGSWPPQLLDSNCDVLRAADLLDGLLQQRRVARVPLVDLQGQVDAEDANPGVGLGLGDVAKRGLVRERSRLLATGGRTPARPPVVAPVSSAASPRRAPRLRPVCGTRPAPPARATKTASPTRPAATRRPLRPRSRRRSGPGSGRRACRAPRRPPGWPWHRT